jgi:hypothetical protein
MAARQILADLHSRMNRRLIPPHTIEGAVQQATKDALHLLDSLPPDMAYSRAQYLVHKDELPMLVLLHVMRNTCTRHIALLQIHASQHINDQAQNLSSIRQSLIEGALELSSILGDSIAHNVVLDPQIAMHAYNGIEIILFQPLRQSIEKARVGITREEAVGALNPFLQVIRTIARVCHLVALIVSIGGFIRRTEAGLMGGSTPRRLIGWYSLVMSKI